MLEVKDCQTRILYPAKLSFTNESKLKTIPVIPKLRESLVADLYFNKYQRKFFRLKVNDTIQHDESTHRYTERIPVK